VLENPGAAFPEHHRGFANGVIQSALKFGNAVGTFGSGLLMAMYGWRPVFIGVGLEVCYGSQHG
jgi:MFS family permease